MTWQSCRPITGVSSVMICTRIPVHQPKGAGIHSMVEIRQTKTWITVEDVNLSHHAHAAAAGVDAPSAGASRDVLRDDLRPPQARACGRWAVRSSPSDKDWARVDGASCSMRALRSCLHYRRSPIGPTVCQGRENRLNEIPHLWQRVTEKTGQVFN